MTIPTLGPLTPGPYGVLEAAPIAIPLFGGQALPVRVSGLTEADAAAAEAAITAFLALGEGARAEAEPRLFSYYQEIDSAVDGGSGCHLAAPSEVWAHLDPRGLELSKSRDDARIYLQVFAECAWEPEHGVQLVYRDGTVLTRVSEQDGNLD